MAALRVLRYLILTEQDVAAVSTTGIPYLIVRSMDVVLNNSGERMQAARLCQRLLAVAKGAQSFPSPVTRALVSIGFDGLVERDKLHKASLSILCQLGKESYYTSMASSCQALMGLFGIKLTIHHELST